MAGSRLLAVLTCVLLGCGDDGPTGDAGTSGPGASGSGSSGSTASPGCDVDDPEMVVDPGPGDRPGDPCCSDRESCTGADVKGMPAQTYHVGDGLVCVNGSWQVDNRTCTMECEEGGHSSLGCFWDSEYGLYWPLCGCQ